MKNLSSFEAFKLNKVQMNVIAGGDSDAVKCQIYDEEGFSDLLTAPKGMNRDQAQQSLEKAYGGVYEVECYDVHYVG